MSDENVVIDITDDEVDFYCNQDIDISDFYCGDSVGIYLKEAVKYPLLSVEEERKYTTLYYETRDPKIRELLVNHNLRLVISVAKTFNNTYTNFADLIQEGNVGLMKGVDRYNPEVGCKLVTYCIWWVRQSIMRYIHNNVSTIRVPVHMSEIIYKYRKFCNKYQASNLGIEPTDKEVMEALKVDSATLSLIKRAAVAPISLDMPVGEDGETTIESFYEADVNVEEDVERSALKADLAKVLNGLTDRERKVLEYRFGLNDGNERTLEEVGAVFNVTRERIRQIESKAIRKLRTTCKKAGLKVYLK